MAFRKSFKAVNMELFFDEIPDAVKDALIAELSPVIDKMVKQAKQNVHVGGGRRDPRPVYKKGSNAGKSWTSRDPGRLRESIRGNVTRRHDKTAVLGFFEAGDFDAYYALMQEMGTPKNKPNPFFRNAFNAHYQETLDAVNRALENAIK